MFTVFYISLHYVHGPSRDAQSVCAVAKGSIVLKVDQDFTELVQRWNASFQPDKETCQETSDRFCRTHDYINESSKGKRGCVELAWDGYLLMFISLYGTRH